MVFVLFFGVLFVSRRAEGQDLPVYQLYLWQPFLINPAVNGSGVSSSGVSSSGVSSSAACPYVQLLDRHQWPGAFKHAPKTQVLTAGKSFTRKRVGGRRHGLGLQLVNDANGAYRQLRAGVAYSYHITVDRRRNLKLGFGLMPSVIQATYDERDFTLMDDPIITRSVEKEIRPDLSTGIYLYSDRFHAGISAVQLLGFTPSLNASRSEPGYFLHGGTLLPLSGDWSLQPGLSLAWLSSQIQSDLNARLTYKESYWLMLSYRHHWQTFPGQPSRLLLYAGLHHGNLSFGYGYDLGLSSMVRYGHGSHEFMVGYRFCPRCIPCRAYQ